MKKFLNGMLLIVLGLGIALANGPAMADDFLNQPEFTKAELDKFLADYPDFTEWAEKNSVDLDEMDIEESTGAFIISKNMRDFLDGKNWKAERFFYVANKVGMGLAQLISPGMMAGDMDALNAQRDMIVNNPSIPEDQKKEMLAEMDEAAAQAQASQADLAIIAPSPAEMALINENKEKILSSMAGGMH